MVELSTVDEGALERALNEWTAKGWNLDGVQFAMRDASKRPAMAFIFFTRPGAAAAEPDVHTAREKLVRLAQPEPFVAPVGGNDWETDAGSPPPFQLSARERLAKLAGLDEPEPLEEGLTLEPEE
ncbi:hypothetical protein LZ198_15845 [Myxococcus sp. K15C18031901]|uniref:hypothetical protein n=1 Tax=Myxococcus dinghuensis TaxID=2906761 RepID=UPI0020A7189E|nr:hypothetical protein [Myxococcus dinghuensis]MCP3100341.1 hypothetical protein [Myxococcus dinghuensis]